MKMPNEIIRYKTEVIKILEWAVFEGHIKENQKDILIENIEDIELKLYPKEMYKDENGWNQIKEE